MGRDSSVIAHRGEVVRVSIHAPAWGATCRDYTQTLNGTCFNPRARMGRDAKRLPPSNRRRRFNPRARMGRDLLHRNSATETVVSIHAPAWGATGQFCGEQQQNTRFNPRARMGRDIEAIATIIDRRNVSIHAPAWGATSSA